MEKTSTLISFTNITKQDNFFFANQLVELPTNLHETFWLAIIT